MSGSDGEISRAMLKNSKERLYVSLGDTNCEPVPPCFNTCKSYRPWGRLVTNRCSTLSTGLVLESTRPPELALYKNRSRSLMFSMDCCRFQTRVTVAVNAASGIDEVTLK